VTEVTVALVSPELAEPVVEAREQVAVVVQLVVAERALVEEALVLPLLLVIR